MAFAPLESEQEDGERAAPVRVGFTPLSADGSESAKLRRGFTPIEADTPSFGESLRETLEPAAKTVRAMTDPVAVGETAAHLATGAVAMPVAGIAGLGAAAAKAFGAEVDPVAVVEKTGSALTYRPKTERGEHLARATLYPLEKLGEGARFLGEKTQDVTGSPGAATAVETVIAGGVPLLVPGAVRAAARRSVMRPAEPTQPERSSTSPEPTVGPTDDLGDIPFARQVDAPEAPAKVADHDLRLPVESAEQLLAETLQAEAAQRTAAVADAARSVPGAAQEPPLRPTPAPRTQTPGAPAVTMETAETPQATSRPETPYAALDAALREQERLRDLETERLIGEFEQHRNATADANQGSIIAADSVSAADRDMRARPAEAVEREIGADEPRLASEPTETAVTQAAAEAPKPGFTPLAKTEAMEPPALPAETARATAPAPEITTEVRILGRLPSDASDGALRLVAEKGQAEAAETARAEIARRTARSEANVIADDATAREATTATLPSSDRYTPEAYRYVQEWGEYEFGGQDQAARYAGALERGEGGTWRAEPVGNRWRARRVAEDAVGDKPVAQVDASTAEAPAPSGAAKMTSGTAYTGMLDDATITSTAARRAEPIRREEVLAPLLKSLKATLYEGRVHGKARGWYLPRREAVRIRHKSDLEVTAHELAHLVDDRIFNGFGKQKGVPNTRPWRGDSPEAITLANELRSVSYDQRKVFEGFAEFVRLYMTQPEKARAAAPNFSAWFDGFLERHEYGPALKQARQGMLDWFGQDALDRARSKIGAQADVNSFMAGTWDRFRQATVDDLWGVARVERELKGGIVPLGAYETSRLTRSSGAITEGALRYGSPYVEPNGSIKWVGKGLEQILEPVSKSPEQLNDFLLYAVGKSAKELKGQGRERLFTDTEINAMVGLETPEFKTAMTEYQLWNMRILDFAESKGLINPWARRAWQRSQYLPFHRVGTVTERARGGVSGNWHGIKTLTGGTENIRDVLGNIIGNAHMLIDAALKNEARAKIVEMAETTQGGGRFLTPIPPESRPVKIDKPQIREKLIEAAGGDPRNPPPQLAAVVDNLLANAPYLMEFLVKGQAPTGGNVIAVLKGGKPHYYEVADPILYRAIVALNRPAQSMLIKWLAIPKRIGQASITLTPDFAVANIARDTLMGAITSRAGFLPAVDSIRGFVGRLKNDADYREYLANGGGFASYFLDEHAFRAHLDRWYSKKGFNAKTVLDAPDKFLYFLEQVFDAFEVSTRLGEFKRLREQGVHPRHAAYLSREVSVDFALKGDNPTINALYDIVMFLRPAVVSMDRIYRGLAHDPNRGAIAAKSGAVALASASLYMLNRDNPRYQDLPDWERDSYWHFFVPKPDGGDLHFRYPRIWEIGALGTLAERSVERILENEPKELARDFGRVLRQQFGLNMMPQAIAPLVEMARNKDSFTGRPIEAQSLENLQPFLRAKIGTSETMRTLGMASRNLPEALQFNPVRAEHLLTGYLNTWAMYGLMLSDAALFSDRLPQRRPDDYPVIRRFYRSEPQIATKYEDVFQEMYNEAHRLRATLRELDRQNRREIADELERSPAAGRAGQLERVQQRLAAIRHEAAAVRVSSLPPEEKRARFDALTVERNALLKATVQDVKRSQQAAPQ
ncbi:MAG: hypothetical protein EPO20_15100 [Betaproteobacteria bacterium]|nr:MAG: hypothetical protein EPO20_15100 [Betaproteobacteria bacterium]